MSPARMCSFAATTLCSYACRAGCRRVGARSLAPGGGSAGRGASSSDRSASASPLSTSATPPAWSKRTSVSATTKRLSGRSGPCGRHRDGRLEHRGVVVRRGSRRPGLRVRSASSSETRRGPQPTKEYRPRRPCSTDSSRNDASPSRAQPDVGPERGDQVSGDDGGCVHATKTTLRSEGRASGSEGVVGQTVRPPRSWRRNQAQVRDADCIDAERTASGARFRAWPVP